MKAQDPETGKEFFFVDKCLPFGASISCAVFQAFSDALAHIMKHWTQGNPALRDQCLLTNYLDDFLFIAYTEEPCNAFVKLFLKLCKMIACPIVEEKTEWACPRIVFLGILLDGENFVLAIPQEKKIKAIHQLNRILDSKTVTIERLQKLTGTLNFLCRAVFPGRTYIRRFYNKMTGKNGFVLKRFHHMRVDSEMKEDCRIWLSFLTHGSSHVINRPFVDLHKFKTSETLNFYTDSSAAEDLGFGCVFGHRWFFGRWEQDFTRTRKPSIAYLELAALCFAVLTWSSLIRNKRIIIYCDNQSVVHMVNNMTSRCRNCMILIRHLALDCLLNNRRVFVRYVASKSNYLADSLSRLKLDLFHRLAPQKMNSEPDRTTHILWPLSKVWKNFD